MNTMKVLIADDSKESLCLLKKLMKNSGYEVSAVTNGAEALEQALKETPDIVISDILMPEMDGFQLCQEFRQNDRLKNIPFVFYTAIYTSGEDEKFALSLGANVFIRKPAAPDVLVQEIRSMLEKAKSGALAHPGAAPPEPSLYLTEHGKRVVAKLNEKVAELEEEIARRQQAEKELRESEQELRLMFESMTDGIAASDLNSVIMDANDRLAEMGRYGSADELLGKTAFNCIIPSEHERLILDMQKTLEEGSTRNIEYTLVRADGSHFPAEISAGVMRDASGKPAGFIAIIRDISDRKQLEKK